jgi:N6-L-threonylcarbamoyladenine synthase
VTLIVLGIETSCDETGAALVRVDGEVLSDVVQSQVKLHAPYGGVVPELASRDHLRNVEPVLVEAAARAGMKLADVDGVAVTCRPGLSGALLVGVQAARGLAWALEKPLVGVDHLVGHLLSPFLRFANVESPAAPEYPFVALLASGGHTALYRVDDSSVAAIRELGATRDDAAGEAFDKVAKLLGLPYPGGPHLERLAREGKRGSPRFARPMLRKDQRFGDADFFDVSFSGLKTAVLHEVRSVEKGESKASKADIALAFQDALIETLIEKTARAAEHFHRNRIILGGGVAANKTLVEAMRKRMAEIGTTVYAPSGRLATDNAAMIARAGLFHFENGLRSGLDLNAYASLPIPGLIA